jgi:hypothetical protein
LVTVDDRCLPRLSAARVRDCCDEAMVVDCLGRLAPPWSLVRPPARPLFWLDFCPRSGGTGVVRFFALFADRLLRLMVSFRAALRAVLR